MTRQEEIRGEFKQRFRYTFCFLCALKGWDTIDKIPIDILKEAERCEDIFVDGFLEYLHSQGAVIQGKPDLHTGEILVEPLIAEGE